MLWAFPLYWGVISSLKPEDEVVRPYIELWPDTLTFSALCLRADRDPDRPWYLNSVAWRSGDCPDRRLVAALRLRDLAAALSRPRRALVADPGVLHGSDPGADRQPLRADRHLGLLNTWAGIMLPQLIHPVIIIVYKQFFDQVPQGLPRGGGDGQRLGVAHPVPDLHPMNWGVTTALSIVCLHLDLERLPLAVPGGHQDRDDDHHRRHHPGNDAFGVYYARQLAAAVLAGLPVALAYLIFQRRVTQAITLSAGIKG